MDGWMGGWVDGEAGLRIAYSNQKMCGVFLIHLNALLHLKQLVSKCSVSLVLNMFKLVVEFKSTTTII